ncbi:MAG: hypothetical protein IKA65_03620 [Lentisphaeria bacterium]|nr:hypothetical protein [Lentisphaeria bacterium]
MKEVCKAAVVTYNGQVVCREVEMPELKDNEVLVKVHCSLISPGTEMNNPRALREKPAEDKEYAGRFGYSSAGEIIAVKGDVKDLKVGMRVACMGGGAKHASYNAVPVNLVVPIPDNVSYEEATFASLAATSLQAVRRTEPQLGEYGIVLGLGIVGNLAAQLYQLSGARVLCWEALRNRRAIARKCGLKNAIDFRRVNATEKSKEFAAPYGVDFALMAFGGNADKAWESVLAAMKVSADGHQMGRIVAVGGCKFTVGGGAWSGNVDIRPSSRTGAGYHDPAWEYGKDYPDVFVQFTSQRNARELIALIAEKKLKVTPLITHRIKIEDVGTGCDMLIEHPEQAAGVILEY